MTRSKLPSELTNPYNGPYYESKDEQLQALHQAFKTSDYQSHKNNIPTAFPETGRWVLDHAHYRALLSSKTDVLLWVTADSGCGKSVLLRHLIESSLPGELQAVPAIICYCFFRDNALENSLGTALCAIIHQLMEHLPSLREHARIAFSTSGDKFSRSTGELWNIFQSIVNDDNVPNIVCVLDGFDQCNDRDQAFLTDRIYRSYREVRFKASRSSTLKWIITSRPEVSTLEQFKRISSVVPSMEIRYDDARAEIQAEVDQIARQHVHELSQEFQLSENKTKELLHQITAIKNRTHLWLHLAINAVKKLLYDTQRQASELPTHVPASCEEAYQAILDRMGSEQKTYALTLLSIIIGARRPLSKDELALAVEFSAPSHGSTSISNHKINVKQLNDNIQGWCSELVTVIGDRLYIAHQSVKEFLIRQPEDVLNAQDHLDLLKVRKLMATICVNFLCMSGLSDDSGPNAATSMQTFFEFASEHWADYVRPVEGLLDEGTQSQMKTLYDMSQSLFGRWTTIMWPSTDHWMYKFDMNPIQLAAFNGHNLLLQKFLQLSPGEVDSEDFLGYTSLMWASKHGHLDVVRTLLDRGADVNVRGSTHVSAGTALHAASAAGQLEIVKELVDKGVDVDAIGNASALQVAAVGGHVEVVRFLLDTGADIDKRVRDFGSALEGASQNGNLEVVQLLIKRGADVNTRDTSCGDEHRALFAAAGFGHLDVVNALLEAGADVNASAADDYEGTALQVASARGHLAVVKALLEHGADANHPSKPYGALQAAANQGHTDVVLILLEAGVNVNIPGDHRGTALQEAASAGRLKIVQLLLDWGADVNARSNHNGTALQAATSLGHLETVQILLDKGAEVNILGGFDGSALDAAVARNRTEIKKLLVAKGRNLPEPCAGTRILDSRQTAILHKIAHTVSVDI